MVNLRTMDYLFNAEPSTTDLPFDVEVNTTRPAAVDIQLKIYEILVPIIGCIIIIVNFAIILSSGFILHKGQQPRSTYLFLGNVGLSDFLVGVNVLFSMFFPRSLRNEISCSVQIGLVVASAITSVWSIGLIAVDRYLYILYGLQYQRYIYPLRARLMIVGCWTIGLIVGFLPAMGWRGDTDEGKLCWYVILAPKELVLITAIIGILPLFIIIVLYSIILRHALRKISELKLAGDGKRGSTKGNLRLFRGRAPPPPSSTNTLPAIAEASSTENLDDQGKKKGIFRFFMRKPKSETPPVYNPSKWKAIKVVFFTTGCFFITWGPFFIASFMFSVCDLDKTPVFCDKLKVALASPLVILGLANSLLNPIVYAWWHNGFRQSAKKLYHSIFKKRRDSDPTLPSTVSHRNDGNPRPSASHRVTSETDTSDAEPAVSAKNLLVKNRHVPIENGESDFGGPGESNA